MQHGHRTVTKDYCDVTTPYVAYKLALYYSLRHLSICFAEMQSAGSGDVTAFSSVSSSTVVAQNSSVSSQIGPMSSLTPSVAQPPSPWRVAATAGRQSYLTSNSSSAPRSDGNPVLSTAERDSRAASKTATTADFGRNRSQAEADPSELVRRSDASGTKGGSSQDRMVVSGKNAMSSQPGRPVMPSVKVPASTEAAESFSADTSSASVVQQRPSSSDQHIRPTSDRFAFAANFGAANSLLGLVPGGRTTDTAEKPSAPFSVQSLKPAAPSQDVDKSVSTSANRMLLCTCSSDLDPI